VVLYRWFRRFVEVRVGGVWPRTIDSSTWRHVDVFQWHAVVYTQHCRRDDRTCDTRCQHKTFRIHTSPHQLSYVTDVGDSALYKSTFDEFLPYSTYFDILEFANRALETVFLYLAKQRLDRLDRKTDSLQWCYKMDSNYDLTWPVRIIIFSNKTTDGDFSCFKWLTLTTTKGSS